MFSLYKQTHVGTSIELADCGNFIHPNKLDLAVAKGNVLEVYRLSKTSEGKKLVLFGQFKFFALIKCLSAIKIFGESRQFLLLGFENSLASVVKFNAATNDFVTVSMHSFDKHYSNEGFLRQNYRFISVVDPLNRCTVMTVSETKVLVLPLTGNNLTFLRNQRKLVAHRNLEPGERKDVFSVKEKSLYLIDLVGVGIKEIKDIQFLYGYDQPSILVMHSSQRTWDGRHAVSEFACELVAISLNLKQRSYSIFKRIENLPLDCQSVLTTEYLVDGALIFSPNLILLVSKEVDYVISLNDFAKVSSQYDPHIEIFDQILNIDHCKSISLNKNTVLVCTQDGRCLLLSLLGKRLQLRPCDFELPTLPSFLLKHGSEHIFVGSYNGDSLLVHYTPVQNLEPASLPEKHRPAQTEALLKPDPSPAKAHAGFNPNPLIKTENGAKPGLIKYDESDDILSIFGAENSAAFEREKADEIFDFDFKVTDALLNYSPVADVAKRRSRDAAAFELVSCSGRDKTGALNILYNGVKVKKRAFQQSGFAEGKADAEKRLLSADLGAGGAKVIALARAGKTSFVSEEEELQFAVGNSGGFCEDRRTVDLLSFFGNTCLVQICHAKMLLFDQKNRLKANEISFGSEIRLVSACEPFVVFLLQSGEFFFVKLGEDFSIERRDLALAQKEEAGEVTALSVFREDQMCRQFARKRPDDAPKRKKKVKRGRAESGETSSVKEDAYLRDFFSQIGDDDLLILESKVDVAPQEPSESESERIYEEFFVFVARKNGRLELYSLPDFSRTFACANFPSGFEMHRNQLCVNERSECYSEVFVVDVKTTFLGTTSKLFLLSVLSDGSLLVYETFYFDQNKLLEGAEYCPLRLRRVQHGVLAPVLAENAAFFLRSAPRRLLFPFWAVKNTSGVFVAGDNPLFLFSGRGFVKFFPLTPKMSVVSFAETKNGRFLLQTVDGALFLCGISDFIHFECDVPFRRIHVGQSLSKIIEHPSSASFVVSSFGDKMVLPLEYPTKRALKVCQSSYGLKVFDNRSMKHVGSYNSFAEHEYITALAQADIELQKKGHTKRTQHFIAVGTGFQKGEEIACRGKVYVFSVEKRKENKSRVGVIAKRFEQKHFGPVTAIATVGGLLALCIGPKIMLFYWNGKSLIGCAFLDLQFYSTTCVNLKNFLLVGDAYRCFYLLLWEPKSKQLIRMSEDDSFCEITSSEFLVNKSQVAFVNTDSSRNFSIFHYDPKNPKNRGGKKLEHIAKLHSAHLVTKTIPLKAIGASRKFYVLSASADGAFSVVLPLEEKVFRKLRSLHILMTYYLEHYGGTNPGLFRKSAVSGESDCQNFFVDGDVAFRYAELDVNRQIELARKIKSSRGDILKHLRLIDAMTRFS